MFVQGDGWLDLPRSDSLWKHVFDGPQSVINTGDWIDRPSVGIPYLYVATGMELAEALKGRGDAARAAEVFNMAKRIAQAVRLEELVRPAEAEFQQILGDSAKSAPLPGITTPPAAPATKSSEPAKPKTGKKP